MNHQKRAKKKKNIKKKQTVGNRRIQHPERLDGKGRMRQFMKYISKTLKVPNLIKRFVKDSRRKPEFTTDICLMLPILMIVLRYKSFNLFEPRLKDNCMKKIFANRKLPKCIDTISNVIKKMSIDSLEKLHQAILKKAADNKVFKNTLNNGMRFFAVDGFEPFRSSNLSPCDACLEQTYNTNKGEVTDHFHKYVFAYSLGKQPELFLGLQANASKKLRYKDSEAEKAEGELTTVRPLIDKVSSTFPKMFHAGVGDALYPNGPFINFMKKKKPYYDVVAVCKKKDNEPMADAIKVFSSMEPQYFYDKKRKEYVRFWDSDGFEALMSCNHPLRVMKANVFKCKDSSLVPGNLDWRSDAVSTWWITSTITCDDIPAKKLFDVQRQRWDEENVFNELTKHWNIKHSYLHDTVGSTVMMYIFMIAYNLFQLFLYRRMRGFSDSYQTGLSVVEEMKLDYPMITDSRDGLFPAKYLSCSV